MEKELAWFEHAICVMANCGLLEIVAEESVKDAFPMSDTVIVWLPLWPLNPRVPAENSATGALTLMSGVMVTASRTFTLSASKTSGKDSVSVT